MYFIKLRGTQKHIDYITFHSNLFTNKISYQYFINIAGVADSEWVSFESVTFPGEYIKHVKFRLEKKRYETSDEYKYVGF